MDVPDDDEDISRSSSLMASLISALNSADDGVPPDPLDPEANTTVLVELGADDKMLIEDGVSMAVAIAGSTLGSDRERKLLLAGTRNCCWLAEKCLVLTPVRMRGAKYMLEE